MPSRASLKPPTLEPLGDEGMVIVFGEAMDDAVNLRAVAAADAVRAQAWPWVLDVVPSFAAVAVHYVPPLVQTAPGQTPAQAVEEALRELLAAAPGAGAGKRMHAGRRGNAGKAGSAAEPVDDEVFDIPVCYGASAGPDLEEAARQAGISPEALVALHTGDESLRVFMLGFAPGAPYIGTFDARLAVPRRATPRLHVPAGSVGLANRQSFIYPHAGPGGWQLIGRTPLALFDPQADPPALLHPGARVRFRAISEAELAAWPAP